MGKVLVFSQDENKSSNNEIVAREKPVESEEKFEDMEELKEDIYVGIGIKKMKGYKCHLVIDELNKLREHFWETKTNTKNKNWLLWKTIKRAISFDELRASILLEEYNIKPVNGCINHLIDSEGNEYRIPNYCINEPSFEIENVNEKDIKEEKIKLKFYGWKNIEIEVSNKLKGKELKNEIKIREKVEDGKSIRLFYRGKEIQDNEFLYSHDLNVTMPIMLLVK